MKSKEHTTQVRDKVVEKSKAKNSIPKAFSSFGNGALLSPSSGNGKIMAQLKTYQNLKAEQGDHWSEMQP